MTSVLFPEPDAPVMAISVPNGNATSIDCRLLARAPRTTSDAPLPLRRFFGVAIAGVVYYVLRSAAAGAGAKIARA